MLKTLPRVHSPSQALKSSVTHRAWRWYHEELLDCCVPLAKVRENGIVMGQVGERGCQRNRRNCLPRTAHSQIASISVGHSSKFSACACSLFKLCSTPALRRRPHVYATPPRRRRSPPLAAAQFACLARCNGVRASLRGPRQMALDDARALVLDVCARSTTDRVLIASYHRWGSVMGAVAQRPAKRGPWCGGGGVELQRRRGTS
jgi:hypothetical protein